MNHICERCGDDALYEDMGGMITLMHSPIIKDANGNPVDGGANTRTKGIRCTKCNRVWISKQKELEDAQGKEREWTLVFDDYMAVIPRGEYKPK